MIPSRLKLALRVLARRKFFTFVSLVGTAFTLAVLLVTAALLDHTVARSPSTRPSLRTAAENRTRWSRAWLAACMCSERVSVHLTALPSRRAIHASRTSSG